MPEVPARASRTILAFALFRLTGPFHPDHRVSAAATNFLRLVDSSVRSYRAARQDLIQWSTEQAQDLLLLLAASSHLENCVNAFIRAIDMARYMRRIAPEGLLPRKAPVLSDAVVKPFNDLRNATEHTDDDIRKGNLVAGEPFIPKPTATAFVSYGITVPYLELAARLDELQDLAERVKNYHHGS
jgi:hypothetical protein